MATVYHCVSLLKYNYGDILPLVIRRCLGTWYANNKINYPDCHKHIKIRLHNVRKLGWNQTNSEKYDELVEMDTKTSEWKCSV